MFNCYAPLSISCETFDNISSDVFYHINHIAEASTWYHRQFEDEDESLLAIIKGNYINSSVQNELFVHVNDKVNIYLVNKNFMTNGGCSTNSHLMVTLNFDLFDNLNNLNKKELQFIDLINIEQKINKKQTRMIYMIDVTENKDLLRFNLHNYEKNIYKFLKRILWLENEFLNITIYDIYENDITSNIVNTINYESQKYKRIKKN